MGVRWAEVTNDSNHGFRVRQLQTAGDGLHVSLLPYSSAHIENARHWWELPEPSQRPATYLRLLTAQMGCRAVTIRGVRRVHDEYQIDATEKQVLDVTLSLM